MHDKWLVFYLGYVSENRDKKNACKYILSCSDDIPDEWSWIFKKHDVDQRHDSWNFCSAVASIFEEKSARFGQTTDKKRFGYGYSFIIP